MNTPKPDKTADEPRRSQSLIAILIFTIAQLGIIALAIRGTSPAIALWTLIAAIGLVAAFHVAFAGSDFFSAIFANSIGVYACAYVILTLANFPSASPLFLQVGFLLPLFGFASGVISHRRQIQHLISANKRAAPHPFRGTPVWVGPLILVAIVTTLLHIDNWAIESQNAALIVAMGMIGVVAGAASKHITVFLIDCGLVFGRFLRRASKLAQPVFALLTCYSLIAIFFGCLYTIIDQGSATPNFSLNGTARAIDFSDGLYVSLSTLTTVGFGDITATSAVGRILVSVEILCGVILLLFGVEAMLDRSNRPE